MNTQAEPNKAMSRPSVWAFGAVALPLSTIGLPLTIYLAPFYAGEMGLSLAALGTAMLLARILDIVVDPFIGGLSDRWQTRFGRRKPWLLGGSLLVIGSMVMLFHPPKGVTLTYFLLWLGVMYAGFSMVQVPHRAWGAELSTRYDDRTHISSVRQFFGTAGLIAATLVPAIVLQQPGAKSADVLSALSTMMLIVLPIMVILNLWLTPEPARVVTKAQVQMTWKQTYRAVRRNWPLKCILLVLFIGFSAETFRQTITVFYARDVIGVKNLGLVYVYYFVSAFVGVPFWRWLAKRTGKHQALCAGMVVAIATNLGLFTLGYGDTTLFTTMFIIKGFCFGALDLLPAAMMADAADIDTAIHGKARVGFLFALMGVVTNLGQAVGQGLSLNALSWVGYQAAGQNTEAALSAMRFLYCLAPSVVLGLALFIATRYGLSAARHDRLRLALARRAQRQTPASNPA